MGPQFIVTEFTKFAKTWNFEHATSSPGNGKGNGKAESAIKTAKIIPCKALEAGTKSYLAILNYRNTWLKPWILVQHKDDSTDEAKLYFPPPQHTSSQRYQTRTRYLRSWNPSRCRSSISMCMPRTCPPVPARLDKRLYEVKTSQGHELYYLNRYHKSMYSTEDIITSKKKR